MTALVSAFVKWPHLSSLGFRLVLETGLNHGGFGIPGAPGEADEHSLEVWGS